MKSVAMFGYLRDGVGKASTKTLRNEGKVPCVMYGPNEHIHFSMYSADFKPLVYTPNAYKVKLEIDGKIHRAILKDIQFHSVNDSILHADFLEIKDDKEIEMMIPVKLVGNSVGVRQGGKLIVKYKKLLVRCLPPNLPDFIEIRMGLNPTIPDLGSADLDGDGVSNEQEIRWGFNPEYANSAFLEKEKLKMSTRQLVQPGCDSGLKYQFQFDNLPLAENKAFTGKIGNIDTTLQAGENQIMLISVQQAIGQQNVKKKMTIQLLKATQTGAPSVGPVNVIGDF